MCQLCNNIIKYGGHTYENGKCVKCGKSEGFIAPLDEYTLGPYKAPSANADHRQFLQAPRLTLCRQYRLAQQYLLYTKA